MTARFWLPIVFGLGKVALVLIIVLVVLVAVADADEETEMEGTYFVPLTIGDMEGNTFEKVDFLSVVKMHDGYEVDVVTNFFNGHICSFRGTLQRVSENRLEFDGYKDFPRQECVLGITWDQDALVFDALGCRDGCGSRGGLIGATFPLDSRNNPPMSDRTDEELCERVISPDMRITDFTQLEQIVLFARGVDLWECREMLQ